MTDKIDECDECDQGEESDEAVQRIATAIEQAWLKGASIASKTLPALSTPAQAYAVQRRVAVKLDWASRPGERRLWKVGGPSTDAIPTAACLPESLTFPSGSRMSHALAGLAGVESEVAFRISDVQWSTGSVRVLVDACCVALEVVASRFFDPDAISPWLKLADQQMNAALVLGPWQPLPEVPWGSLVCTASFDGAMLAESKQGHPCEDPLWALNWLADHANGQGLALRAGDVVTTGSWLGVLPIKQPGMFSASFSGLGEASLQFD